MRLTLALLAHEVRVQGRSLRFRVMALLFLVLGSSPAVLTFLRRNEVRFRIGAATYPAEVLAVLPLATLVLGFVLALDGLLRERHEGSWETLSVAPFSSGGWVLRRFLALWLIVAALGAVPLLAGAALALRAGEGLAPLPFLVPWLLRVVPIAALAVAGGLLLGAVGDGALPGVALAVVLCLAGGPMMSATVGSWGLDHGLSPRWLGLWRAEYYGARLVGALRGDPADRYQAGMPYPASEAAWDPGTVVAPRVAYAAPCLAVAALALALAPRFLRRTRRERRPWRVREDHPLRSFVGLGAKLWDRYAPGPRPGPGSRAISLLLAAVALVSYGGLFLRAESFRALGRERYRAEAGPAPAVTPTSVVPERWTVRGTLDGRRLDLEVEAGLRNQGPAPVRSVAFELDPTIEIEAIEAPSGARWSRAWNRLEVALARPLGPGEGGLLRLRLTGAPERPEFALGSMWTFHSGFERSVLGRAVPFVLAHGWRRPLVSPTWMSLEAGVLYPRLRYTSWELARSNRSPGAGAFVPEEWVDPLADLTVDLEVRGAGVALVDACGSTPVDGRLMSRCRIPLGGYAIVGGALAEADGAPTFLVFPNHREAVEDLRRILADAGGRMAAAWPGSPPVAGLRVVEVPFADAGEAFPWGDRQWLWDQKPEDSLRVRGRLLLLGEAAFATRRPIESGSLSASFLEAWLIQHRQPVPEEAFLVPWVLRTLARRWLDPGVHATAVLPAARGGPGAYSLPLPSISPWSAGVGARRLGAVLAHLESRVGPTALREAVDAFVARPGPGRIEELFEILAERNGDWALDVYRELFRGTAVPHMVLDGVAFQRTGDGWRVTGRVVNDGGGPQVCPVILTTEIAPVSTRVAVPGEGSVPFHLESPYRPRALLLDPEETCVRYASRGSQDRVTFEGAAGG